MATKLLGAGLKELGKQVGQWAAKQAGSELLKLAVGNMFDATDQKLQAIQAAISALSSKLDEISNDLKDFRLETASQFGIDHISAIETLYAEYTRNLLELAKWTKDRSKKESGTSETNFERAKKSLVHTGDKIKDDVPNHLLRIHYLIVGEVGATGLLALAHTANLAKPKGFLNHYIYMRQIFLRYWAVSMKGITLLQWISDPDSGTTYYGEDSGNTKGPIHIARDHLRDQQGTFNAVVGTNIINLCQIILTFPPGGEYCTIYSEGGSMWDHGHAVALSKADVGLRLAGNDFKSSSDVQLNPLVENKLDPIIMMTPSEQASGQFKRAYKIWCIGVDDNTEFSASAEYKFKIEAHSTNPTRYLQFGHPSGAAKEWLVAALEDRQQSEWRIFACEKPDYLAFQYTHSGWAQDGWWINCEYGRVHWTENGQRVRGGALVKAAERDWKDPYQNFRIGDDKWDPSNEENMPF